MTTTSQTTMLAEVLKADPDHYKPEDAYKFSNERTFKSTDSGTTGIYER